MKYIRYKLILWNNHEVVQNPKEKLHGLIEHDLNMCDNSHIVIKLDGIYTDNIKKFQEE